MNHNLNSNGPVVCETVPKNRGDGMLRETFVLPRDKAREQARSWLETYPSAAYWSRVESWKELDDGSIKFTMVRLPNAD